MGATSVRFAHGQLRDGKILLDIVKQVANRPVGRCWDTDLLVGFCREASEFAAQHAASLGIDSWGVDHGFIDAEGRVVCGPVQYRDPSHLRQYEKFREMRSHLFQLTGIAHQPFNTLYQLAARVEEDQTLPNRSQWYLMPDLMNSFLTGARRHEQTQASTTQLMGLDGRWCLELFQTIGWPVPDQQPSACGRIIGQCGTTPVVSVASHDTGSAVLGVGAMMEGDAYLNVGTWALLGNILDQPCITSLAESGGWTNEWGYRGQIRFLKNIPGFYVINRLHSELGVKSNIGNWLDTRDRTFKGRFDVQHNSLYNPASMVRACLAVLSEEPESEQEWATAALASLVECIANDVPRLSTASQKTVNRIRVVGGGSRSRAFCQDLADTTSLEVVAGPDEATVLGNLALQFVATGEIDPGDLGEVVARSFVTESFQPEGEPSASI